MHISGHKGWKFEEWCVNALEQISNHYFISITKLCLPTYSTECLMREKLLHAKEHHIRRSNTVPLQSILPCVYCCYSSSRQESSDTCMPRLGQLQRLGSAQSVTYRWLRTGIPPNKAEAAWFLLSHLAPEVMWYRVL